LRERSKKQYPKIVFFAMVLNIILNFVLILSLLQISEIWAITGAAIATVISRMFIFFSLFAITKKKFEVSMEFKNLIKPVLASTIMLGGLS